MSDIWRDTMVAAFRDTMVQIMLMLPKLLALFTFILLGLVVAWLVKVLTVRVLAAFHFDALCERFGLSTALSKAGMRRSVSQVAGRLLFWTVFLLFTFMGVDAVDLPATATLISQMMSFLPRVLAAALLLLVGVLASNFLSEAVLIAAVNAQIHEARVAAILVRWGILLFTFAMVLTQLGIANEIVVAAFSITFGGVVLALAIAVGLGSRNVARRAIERRWGGQPEHEDVDELTHI